MTAADIARNAITGNPPDPNKQPDPEGVINAFIQVDADIANLLLTISSGIQGVVVGNAVAYSTRAALYADLAHPAGRLGIVYADSTAALNGIYVKSGASGAGSWAITSLALASTFAASLTATQTEISNARQGRGNLLTNIASIGRRAPSILASIAGTPNAITGTDSLSTADESNDPATTYILVPTAVNTGSVTLSVNGDTPRPVRSFANSDLVAGDLAVGAHYLLISDGARYRVAGNLGTAPVRSSDVAAKANQSALQAVLDEIVAARNGGVSLDARLDASDLTLGNTQLEILNARQGRGNLLTNIAAISRRAPTVLATIAGTDNAITATDALSSADESNDPATSYLLIPAVANTGSVTLAVNGDTPRPIRTFAGAELVAGDLVAGNYYLLISDGGRYRVFSDLGATVVRPSDLAAKANQTSLDATNTTVGNINPSVAPSAIYFGSSPIIYDYNGIYGQVRTLYFNRDFFARTVLGSTSFTIGTDSTRIPGYTELQTAGASTLYKVIIARSTGVLSIHAQSALPALSSDAIYLLDVKGSIISNERYPVQMVEGGSGIIHPFFPAVIEDQADGSAGVTVLIPRLQWSSGLMTASPAAPADGSLFSKEVTGFAPSATPQILAFDQIAAAAGTDPIKLLSAPRAPESQVMKTFLSGFAGSFQSLYPLLGRVPGGSVPNQLSLGRNNVDNADILFQTTVKTAITDATANALGFTTGVKNPSGNALYGSNLQDTTPGRWITARFYLLSDVDDDFPLARAYVTTATGAGNTQLLSADIPMEKRHSARVRSYLVRAKVPATGGPYIGLQVGVLASGRDITVFGLQAHSGGVKPSWIMRQDYPEGQLSADSKLNTVIKIASAKVTGKVLYPNKMFLISGRAQKLYANQVVEDRTDGLDAFLTLDAREPASGGQWPLPTTAKGEITIDPANVAPTGRLTVRTSSQASPDSRYMRDFEIKVANASLLSGISRSVLCIGDSLIEFAGTIQAMIRELATCGMTLTAIGTVDCREADQSNGGDNFMKGEGRGSRKSTNYTYQAGVDAVTPCDPFADSFIPTYLAMTTEQKKAYNPFLRPSTGGDNPAWVQNGYIFDPEFWRTRFTTLALPVPKFVPILLGTNDITQVGLPAGTAALTLALQIMTGAIRAAWPSTYIGLIVPPLPRSKGGDGRWPQQVLFERAVQGVVNAANTPFIEMVPTYAHASSEVGWATSTTATDTVTGSQTAGISDDVHYRGAAKEQVGRTIAAWIACKETGA